MLAQPGFQSLQQRRALRLARMLSRSAAQPLSSSNAPLMPLLNIEQRIDALDRLQRDRRDRLRILPRLSLAAMCASSKNYLLQWTSTAAM
ncbi:hypothetical protein FXB41_32455 [Bradyrhizobium canariense]|uniref:hypothetical protein n=1 Tax=Bradyrhizobium canariense TaxID=255045 RepID=UPI001CA494CA|nr:hypothetical protein [Bradyrhizobium canariense]MBW5439305.1 hypothetical protein [Bradyrhizobium canariense]